MEVPMKEKTIFANPSPPPPTIKNGKVFRHFFTSFRERIFMEDHSMLRLCFATKTSMKPGKPSLLGKKRNDEGFPGVIDVFLAK